MTLSDLYTYKSMNTYLTHTYTHKHHTTDMKEKVNRMKERKERKE